MPKRARSGVPNLYKKHTAACRNREALKCDCPWYGKYKRINVNLARWSGQYVDPRRRQHAVVVLNRLRASATTTSSGPTVTTRWSEDGRRCARSSSNGGSTTARCTT